MFFPLTYHMGTEVVGEGGEIVVQGGEKRAFNRIENAEPCSTNLVLWVKDNDGATCQ